MTARASAIRFRRRGWRGTWTCGLMAGGLLLLARTFAAAQVGVAVNVTPVNGEYQYTYQVINNGAPPLAVFSLDAETLSTNLIHNLFSRPGWNGDVFGPPGAPPPPPPESQHVVIQWAATFQVAEIAPGAGQAVFGFTSPLAPGPVPATIFDERFNRYDGQLTGPAVLGSNPGGGGGGGPQPFFNGSASGIPGNPSGVRLTTSDVGESGSVWYMSSQNPSGKEPIAGGFQAVFTFRISNPGPPGFVDASDGQPGGDGFAFAIQNSSLQALGDGGGYLGYGGPDGIPNSLAVEFDTYDNPELGDPSGNHVSVHTGGTGRNGADSRFSLGDTTAVPNLKDGAPHQVRIVYQPGLLQVYVDNFSTPVLNVGVDITNYLALDAGSAWVGFTAGTGSAFETHDILSFGFPTANF